MHVSIATFCLFGVLFILEAGAVERPNVLFITVDDLRCEMGCYGSRVVKTPNIDRLSRLGMRFDRAYVQVTVCNPSRTSLLTGLRPDTTRVFDNRTHFRKKLPDVVTLPQLFRENGYHTFRLGKIFHDGASMDDGKAWDKAVYPRPTARGLKGEGRNLTNGALRWCAWRAAEGTDEDQPDGQIAREAVKFLNQSHDRPFFLALGFYKPHDPFVAPKKYFEHYPIDSITLYRDPPDATPLSPPTFGAAFKREFDKFSDRERREFQRAYYAATTFMDAQFGKVFDALQQNSYANNTLIFFLSDHGYHLGERGWWNKSNLTELSCRTPLIVYAPGMKAAGEPCCRLVEFIDIYPTLTKLCKLQAPSELDGRSFAPLLDDPSQGWKEAAFTQFRRGELMGRSVRTVRWRYTEWGDGRAGRELYDHTTDPREYRNLAADAAHAREVTRLMQLLRSND
jgi:uncharacterized sulfatase